MSYATHAAIAVSGSLRQRITACAAVEGVPDPPRWVNAVIWRMIVPEWSAAWAASAAEDKGADEAAITDDLILMGVRRILTSLNPQPWTQPSGAHDAYGKYIHVTHNGGVWYSTIDANVWEPGVSGWTQVA